MPSQESVKSCGTPDPAGAIRSQPRSPRGIIPTQVSGQMVQHPLEHDREAGVTGPCKLPTPPTSLVGRERERAAVKTRLRRTEVRLLTLTGAGGVGKPRLALAAARDVADAFADGVFFVDLAPTVDPSLVPSAIARALDVAEAASRPLTEILVEHLRGRSLLLVLDNVEQVLGAAPMVAGLVGACPALKILVTSRAA